MNCLFGSGYARTHDLVKCCAQNARRSTSDGNNPALPTATSTGPSTGSNSTSARHHTRGRTRSADSAVRGQPARAPTDHHSRPPVAGNPPVSVDTGPPSHGPRGSGSGDEGKKPAVGVQRPGRDPCDARGFERFGDIRRAAWRRASRADSSSAAAVGPGPPRLAPMVVGALARSRPPMRCRAGTRPQRSSKARRCRHGVLHLRSNVAGGS